MHHSLPPFVFLALQFAISQQSRGEHPATILFFAHCNATSVCIRLMNSHLPSQLPSPNGFLEEKSSQPRMQAGVGGKYFKDHYLDFDELRYSEPTIFTHRWFASFQDENTRWLSLARASTPFKKGARFRRHNELQRPRLSSPNVPFVPVAVYILPNSSHKEAPLSSLSFHTHCDPVFQWGSSCF